jgi:tRNA (cytidine/uridine-2'-O-)-methyltransferase
MPFLLRFCVRYYNILRINIMLICLFEPDIPQNTGSLIRLSACLDIPLHIIEPCGFPFDDKRMRRVAMDYYNLAEIKRHNSWQAFIEFYQQQANARLLLLSTHANQHYTDFVFHPEDILLFGRESSGVPDYVREAANSHLRIPVQPGARSLNLVQAASMVTGEALRQTKGFP